MMPYLQIPEYVTVFYEATCIHVSNAFKKYFIYLQNNALFKTLYKDRASKSKKYFLHSVLTRDGISKQNLYQMNFNCNLVIKKNINVSFVPNKLLYIYIS